MEKLIIVANWKCNPITLRKAKLLFSSIKRGVGSFKKVEIVICPPFVYLATVDKRQTTIKFGGQDCFWEKEGAFTGEISPSQLKNLGCQYVIIGHSERRKYFSETNKATGQKIKAALLAGLKPILCIGETRQERRKGKIERVLRDQLKKALTDLSAHQLQKLIIAYEPVWAIGKGRACSFEDAKGARHLIKKSFKKKISILYGGSVNSKNAKGFIKEAGFQGFLVGRASLEPKEFIKIVKVAAES